MLSSLLLATLAILALTTTKVEGAEPYPSGDTTIWEFVNCVEDSTGYETAEAWIWWVGNHPSTTSPPNGKYKVFEGGPYYWENAVTKFSTRKRFFTLHPYMCSFIDRCGVDLRRCQYEPKWSSRYSSHT